MNNDDYWKKAVDMLTGYMLPDRKTLFDDLKGNEGIPLMHVRMPHAGSEYTPGFVSGGGWRYESTDYVIPFYNAPKSWNADPAPGTTLDRWWAYITILGTMGGDDRLPPSGYDNPAGSDNTSQYLKDKGRYNEEGEYIKWNTRPLAQYSHGSADALFQIAYYPHNTWGFNNRGLSVDDSSYVDLLSFTEVGRAFDRAVNFFEDGAQRMKEWDGKEIGEESDTWSGTGASLFKHLIHKLNRNYDGYAEQLHGGASNAVEVSLDGYTLTSKPARALAYAQSVIRQEAENLYNAWLAWRDTSSPQRWLYDLLQQARLELFDNQYERTDIEPGTGTGLSYSKIISTAGFRQMITIEGKEYGAPGDTGTWKAIGEEAVRRWDHHAQEWLSAAGSESIERINEALRDVVKAFDDKLSDRDQQSLSEIANKEQTDKERDEIRKQNEEDRARAEKDRDEIRKQNEEDRARAEKDRDDALAENDESRKQAEEDRDEIRKQNESDRARAEKDRADALAENDESRKQAEADSDAARKTAEQDRNQAKQDQDAVRKQNEQDRATALTQQDEARAKAEQDSERLRAEQDEARAKAEKDSEEAKKSAAEQQSLVLSQNAGQRAIEDAERERIRNQQQQDRDEALAQAKKDREEAEKQQDEERQDIQAQELAAREQAETDRQKVLQDQQETRDQANRDQEEARQQALKEQTQAKYDLERDKADARAQYEQDLADAKAERDSADEAADQQSAQAKKDFDQARADATAQRDNARQKAESERAQAKLEYEKALSDGQISPEAAKAEYDQKLADINDREQETIEKADQQEAAAKEEYEREKAAIQQEQDQASQDAEQARKQAKADYDEHMADVQSESDRLRASQTDTGDLIRQRIDALPQPSALSSTYSPYGSEFGGNLYNLDDLGSALGRGQELAVNPSAGTGEYSGSPGMLPQTGKGGAAGGEGGSASERTRSVLEQGVSRAGRRGGTLEAQENSVATRGAVPTASGTPFAPPMSGGSGPQQNQATESSDRERTTWLAEDEEVWGTDEGGAPQALGR
ncbi:AAWKG family protein [Streptomyces sp. NPDC087901]|uniref:AAWKG family protein n=1 Tax=Streptomyces sp. NPDC087901 TaxID=3365818 RepID=UPI0037FC6D39